MNLLLQNFADVRLQDSKKQNPLHLACLRGDLDIYKILVGACPAANNELDIDGKTPLDLAFQNKHDIIIEHDKNFTINLFNDKENKKILPTDFTFI